MLSIRALNSVLSDTFRIFKEEWLAEDPTWTLQKVFISKLVQRYLTQLQINDLQAPSSCARQSCWLLLMSCFRKWPEGGVYLFHRFVTFLKWSFRCHISVPQYQVSYPAAITHSRSRFYNLAIPSDWIAEPYQSRYCMARCRSVMLKRRCLFFLYYFDIATSKSYAFSNRRASQLMMITWKTLQMESR